MLRRALPARAAVAALALALAAAVTSNVVLLGSFAEASRRDGYPYFQLPSDGEEVRWSEFEAAFAWLRAHSDPGDVLSAGFDTMTALYTGRPTLRAYAQHPSALYYGDDAPPVGTPADLARLLDEHRPRYLFVSPLPAYADEAPFYELVTGFLRTYPGRLRLAYQGTDQRFAILALADAGGAPRAAAGAAP